MAAEAGGGCSMSLLLTLERGPRAQAVRQARMDKGELVIGRSPDADWQIDDPDMFVSRAHCKITAEQDDYFVTDTSSSGLFIDDSSSPLGTGNSARLRNGMRLRLGDYVLWVDLHAADDQPSAPERSASRQSTPQSRVPVNIDSDDFFSAEVEEVPQPPRPANRPNPFEQPEPGAFRAYERAHFGDRGSPAFDDPFSLDPVAAPASDENDGGRHGAEAFNDPFGLDPPPVLPSKAGAAGNETDAFDGDFGFSAAAGSDAGSGSRQIPGQPASPAAKNPPVARTDEAVPPYRNAAPRPAAPQPQAGPGDKTLWAAFLRGMGIDEAEFPSNNPATDMEKFGREYRMMMEGLMQLLRKRAEEKGNARVSQTMVGASEVNPLKFLPTVDDALATILTERSPGFLAGEPAIADAIRDLANHHVRTWRGMQSALRRMIDRFDPAALEEELKSSSTIETLLAGGRGAKLWELYQKRHHEIAMNAESRFMGDIGADFRDAYEEE